MKAEQIKTVVVVGAGVMGDGIAQNFAQNGMNVRLMARTQETLSQCVGRISHYLAQFDEFKLLNDKPQNIIKRISTYQTSRMEEAVQGADFVIETIPEIVDAKKELFAQLDKVLAKNVVIGSNTSSIPITTLTEGMQTADRVVGLHYFNPANIIPLVEVHRGKATSDEAVETAKAVMIRSGKKPILVRKEVPGFIINRLTGAMEREVDYLLDQGVVTAEDLDAAVKASFGFRLACLGPQEAEDMIGLDTAARVSGRIFKVLSNATEASKELVDKVAKGELGIKSGKGWYDYSGKTREQVMEANNRLLLAQLAVYKAREAK